MRPSAFLVSILAIGARAAPTYPKLSVDDFANPANSLLGVAEYFNLAAQEIQDAKRQPAAPACDLTKAQMPLNGLAPPSVGLVVSHVAVGRGTQNYTCDPNNADAVPKSAGALATLFNASCTAATSPNVLQKVPGMAVNFNISTTEMLGPLKLLISGHHYFVDSTTPFFDLNTSNWQIGTVPCAKNGTANAPADAPVGQQGEGAVAWLKLTAKDGATGNLKEVYRVNTAGGNPPSTCKGMPQQFQVQYSAIYWFWKSA